MRYPYIDHFHLATINMELLLYPLHVFAHFGLLLHYTMKHDSTNPSTLKKRKKILEEAKAKKNILNSVCSQVLISPSQSYTWKISVEIFFSPGCCQKNHSVTRLGGKRRVGYMITEIKRLLQHLYSCIQGPIRYKWRGGQFRHLKIKINWCFQAFNF